MNVAWSRPDLFTEDSLSPVPSIGGIYILCKEAQGKTVPYYVGKAEDLSERLHQHLSPQEENNCIKQLVASHVAVFTYAAVPLESDRAAIEKFLYDQYKPECNQQDPGGTPIAVNLPPLR